VSGMRLLFVLLLVAVVLGLGYIITVGVLHR
jgi:hypothetical protein